MLKDTFLMHVATWRLHVYLFKICNVDTPDDTPFRQSADDIDFNILLLKVLCSLQDL